MHPVIVTEWDQNSTHDCIASAPTESTLLLGYLMSKQIGLVGFAFDLPGTIISDYASYAPTSFTAFACGVPNGGPGELLFGEYAGLAQADASAQVVGAPAWALTNTALTVARAARPGPGRAAVRLAAHVRDRRQRDHAHEALGAGRAGDREVHQRDDACRRRSTAARCRPARAR